MSKYVRTGLAVLAAVSLFASLTAYAHGGKHQAVMMIQNGVVSNVSTQAQHHSEPEHGPLTPPAQAQQQVQHERSEHERFADQIKVPDSAAVLIVVDADRTADHGTLHAYKRAADRSWECCLTAPAMIGMKGLYKTIEGDCKTPVGVFRMNTPFGILDRQEGFPENYLKVNEHHYWNGDSDSSCYNKLVDDRKVSGFNKKASEHLIDYKKYYDYGIEIGYNPEGTAHRGSAIFLHCSVNGAATHGCIGIPAEDMVSVLKMYNEGNTYFAVYDHADPSVICR